MLSLLAASALRPSPPVTAHQLLTGFQWGQWEASIAFGLQVVALGAYAVGVRRLAARGRRWSPWRALAFLGGEAVLFVALVSGLASYDDSVFTVHIIQHLLLMMVAPPLLALGAPITLALQASGRRWQTRIVRILRGPLPSLLFTPLVAGASYFVSMWVDLGSGFYPYTLTHPLAHDLTHLIMFWLGCLFWWLLVAADQLPHRPSPGVRVAMLAAGMPFEAFLGVALLSMRTSVAPEHTVADTQAGGALFWVVSMLITLVAALVVAWQWMRTDEREAVRIDRRAARAHAPDRAGGPAVPAAGPGPAADAWAAEWLRRTGSVPRTAAGPPGVQPPPV